MPCGAEVTFASLRRRSLSHPIPRAHHARQATFALDIVEASLRALGATLEDVVRTSLFVRHVERDWEAVARVHGSRFGRSGTRPANTLVGAALAGEEYLVEVEVEAEVEEAGAEAPPPKV